MLTVLLLRVSMLPHESLILADSCCIAAMVLSTTCWPSSARLRASLECCEARAAFWAISWAAAPSWLIAAATLLVREACWSELNIDELEAATTRNATSLTCPVAEDTSRIEVWMRSTKRLNDSPSAPNSSWP
ncbi:hypothetical protein D3C79_895210 [compost metagenome]